MTRNEVLKQVMVGLIYPAVLGTVLYSFLGAAIDPIMNSVLGHTTYTTTPWLKWVFLLTTIVFYCCDYLYIMFTREFVIPFFICDLIFLTGLYVTFFSIDIRTSDLPNRNVLVVAVCYLVFMFLYLAWDIHERRRTEESEELRLYNHVILWEVVSLIALILWLGSEVLVGSFPKDSAILGTILVLITSWFAVLAFNKRRFYILGWQDKA